MKTNITYPLKSTISLKSIALFLDIIRLVFYERMKEPYWRLVFKVESNTDHNHNTPALHIC